VPDSIILIDDPKGKVDESGKARLLLPVFQKVELAQRFIARRDPQLEDPLAVCSVGELLQVILWLKKEVRRVAFFVGPNRLYVYTTEEVIQHLNNMRGNGGG
jgi:hypothetical protein